MGTREVLWFVTPYKESLRNHSVALLSFPHNGRLRNKIKLCLGLSAIFIKTRLGTFKDGSLPHTQWGHCAAPLSGSCYGVSMVFVKPFCTEQRGGEQGREPSQWVIYHASVMPLRQEASARRDIL